MDGMKHGIGIEYSNYETSEGAVLVMIYQGQWKDDKWNGWGRQTNKSIAK